ncbi:unnamed protein product [Larinioides sclopetarius]
MKSVKCMEEYDVKCDGEIYRRLIEPERYANITSVLSEICEEGSTLNEVATSNLKCFNETFSNTNCRLEKEDFIDSFREEVKLDEFTESIDFVPGRIYCMDMIKSGKCLEEYDMTCKGEEHRRLMRPERYANILSVLSEICEEGSTLNEVATSNLKCFNETFSNTNCLVEALNFIEPFKEDVPQDEFTGSTYYVPERIFCMAELHLLGCLLEDIARNCGLRARHATVEFLQRTSYAVDECPLESRETLLEDIDTFDLTEGQKSFAISELERMKISNEA